MLISFRVTCVLNFFPSSTRLKVTQKSGGGKTPEEEKKERMTLTYEIERISTRVWMKLVSYFLCFNDLILFRARTLSVFLTFVQMGIIFFFSFFV